MNKRIFACGVLFCCAGVLLAQKVPVPAIRTPLGSMPGIDALPVRAAMPDPLTAGDGTKVTTPAQWEQRRREIRRTLEYYAVGAMPPAPGNVKSTLLKEQDVLAGKAHYRLVHLVFGPRESLGFDVALYTPAGTGPFPVIVNPSFALTPGAAVLPLMPRPPEQGHGGDTLAITLPASAPAATAPLAAPPDPDTAAREFAPLFDRGYALAIYHYQDAGEDNIARNPDGSWAYRNTRFFPAYPDYDWSLLGAWAWSVSRCIDFLETDAAIDKSKIAVTGHSRIGKAVLIAGAFDERIAVTAPAGSGAGGTGAYRFNGTARGAREGLDDMLRKYPNWFSPHLYEFAGHVEKIPFDQHWFMALCAPRGFISLEGTIDPVGFAPATHQAILGAQGVYQLLGAPAHLGVNFAVHAHQLAPADLVALMDFMDQQFRGKPIDRRFDEFPPETQPATR